MCHFDAVKGGKNDQKSSLSTTFTPLIHTFNTLICAGSLLITFFSPLSHSFTGQYHVEIGQLEIKPTECKLHR